MNSLVKGALPGSIRPPQPSPAPDQRSEFRTPAIAGGIALTLMLVLMIAWAKMTMISGAIIAHGQAVVHGKPKLVQSLDGGEVRSISVTEGQTVKAGEVLLTLDPTMAQVNLGIARARLAAALARAARLTAEQTGADQPDFTYPPLPVTLPDTAADEEGQRQIFAARAELNRGRRDKLAQTRAQIEEQIKGLEGQIAAVRSQITLTEQDLTQTVSLVEQGLARTTQQNDLERQKADLYGRLSTLESDAARSKTAMSDAEIEVLQADRSFREGVVTDLREATTAIQEQTLEAVNREAQLRRMEVRAPADGVVNQLQATTVGGVVAPGATLLELVPTSAGLDFEVRIDPRAIDQVRPGQPVRLVLSALPRATTRDLKGSVTTVSADVIADPVTGQRFYKALIAVPPDQMALVQDVAMVPGMPVEAYLQTGDRSALSYLLKPVTDHLNNAFRD